MITKVKEFINNNFMLQMNDNIVVGLSGGADSVCLLKVLCELKDEYKLNLMAVHINHMLRGDEAYEDEDFAINYAMSLGVKIKVFRKDIKGYAKEQKITTEEGGRIYRYSCFEEVCDKYGFNKIAVAHNQNDVVETVIFNMARGTGLKGLRGIVPVRDNIIRPILCVSRNDIESYLQDNDIQFRTDSSNNTLDYDRNKIRHIIIPELLNLNNQALDHIYNLSNIATDNYSYILDRAKILLDKCSIVENLEKNILYKININEFNEEVIVKKEVILMIIEKIINKRKDITKTHIEDILSIANGETGKGTCLPYNLYVTKSYNELIFMEGKTDCDEAAFFLDLIDEGVYDIDSLDSKLTVKKVIINDEIEKSLNFHDFINELAKKEYTKYVDCDKMLDKPSIRTPRENDYIIINEKGNKKKLTRFFIDNKVDVNKRLTWPVVACGNEIVWVIGFRLGYNYKITEFTSNAMILEYVQKK